MYVRTQQGLQEGPTLRLDRAVRLNRHYARLLGWQNHVGQIMRLLGLPRRGSSERELATALVAWQRNRGLTAHGIIEPRTWSRMRVALGVQDLSRSLRPGLAGLSKAPSAMQKIRPREIRKLIKIRSPELDALIARVPLPCKTKKGGCVFEEVRRETIGGELHVWILAVQFTVASLSDGGRTLALEPITTTTKGITTVTRRMLIEINPLRFDSPELRKQIPDSQKRLEFLVAESLFHELIHATILIESAVQAATGGTSVFCAGVFCDFERMLRAANSARLASERSDVKVQIVSLAALAGVPVTDPAANVNKHFEFLINEKFAKQAAASVFGRPIDNARVADAYSKTVAARIESSGTPPADPKAFRIRVAQLSNALSILYDRVDAILAVPEMIPPPSAGPIIQAEPAIERL